MDESDRNEGKKFRGKELKRRKKRCGFFFSSAFFIPFCLTRFLFVVGDIRYSSMTWVYIYIYAEMKVVEIHPLLLSCISYYVLQFGRNNFTRGGLKVDNNYRELL